jgi:ribosomal protein S15P/S13E
MREDSRSLDFGSFIPTGFVDASVLRAPNRYSVPRDMGDGHTKPSPVVAVSIEEKVADLIRAYPHLEAFLKSHSKDPNARIRDLEISSQERDQLLYQIMAARRQQVPPSGNAGQTSLSANGPEFRSRFYQPRRRKPAQEWPNSGSRSSHAGPVTGKFHKRLWG